MVGRRLGAVLLAVFGVVACTSESTPSGDFARPVDIGGRVVYLTCEGRADAGAPTIVLISGYHDSSDVWIDSDVLDLLTPAVRGVVFVDAFSATIPALFGARWPIYRDQGLNPPVDQMPVPSMRGPDSERVDLDASVAEVLAGPAFPKIPVVVLTKTESFAGLRSFPGLPADEAIGQRASDLDATRSALRASRSR